MPVEKRRICHISRREFQASNYMALMILAIWLDVEDFIFSLDVNMHLTIGTCFHSALW